MRSAGIDEAKITGTASDYEKFRFLCAAMPDLLGHPVHLAAHLLLRRLLDCPLMLNEANCDAVWQAAADYLALLDSWEPILQRLQIAHFFSDSMPADGSMIRPLFIPKPVYSESLNTVEAVLLTQLATVAEQGCTVAYHALPQLTTFVRPDPYHAELACKKQSIHQSLDTSESACLTAQQLRTLGREYVRRGITLLLSFAPGSCPDAIDELLFYLNEVNALPQTILCHPELFDRRIRCRIPLALAPDAVMLPGKVSRTIETLAAQSALGQLVGTMSPAHCTLDLLQPEFFRRALCDALGRMAAEGIIPQNTEQLHRIVDAICYHNSARLLQI